jgi:hypothetical protein
MLHVWNVGCVGISRCLIEELVLFPFGFSHFPLELKNLPTLPTFIILIYKYMKTVDVWNVGCVGISQCLIEELILVPFGFSHFPLEL